MFFRGAYPWSSKHYTVFISYLSLIEAAHRLSPTCTGQMAGCCPNDLRTRLDLANDRGSSESPSRIIPTVGSIRYGTLALTSFHSLERRLPRFTGNFRGRSFAVQELDERTSALYSTAARRRACQEHSIRVRNGAAERL